MSQSAIQRVENQDDSVSESHVDNEDYGKPKRNGAFDDADLNHFLGAMHETTAIGDEKGMPPLDWIKANFKTKSGAIRYLHQRGFSAQDISKHLGIKYQHAYNVCNQHLKRGPNEVYLDQKFQCPHDKATIIVDVVVRRGVRDPDSSRTLYRVCSSCAVGLIPGVTAESIAAALPGVK